MSCLNDKPTPRWQNPESAGKNPPDVTLDHIAKDLLHFNEFETLNKTEKMIEKKYDIKKKHGCWPDDDIKRAWGETQQMNKMEREEWAIVIILQIVKRSLVQSDLKENLVQSYEGLHLTDTPERMKTEKENVGPKADDGLCSTDRPERSYQSKQKTAGADEWLFGAGLKQSQCKLTEESGPASESQFSGGAAEGDEQHSRPNPTTYGTETPFADSNPSRHHTGVSENMPIDETIYIPIPLKVMFYNECQNVQSRYKLINGAPSNVPLWKKSYAMSFDNITRNAKWVYEVLNKETSVNNCVQEPFGDPYVRGHLAAAVNHRWYWEARNDANLNCNIIPQHKTLNTGPWKVLENWCRELRDQTGVHNVHVYSGPLYYRPILEQMNPRIIGDKLVPTHLFKVIIVENEDGTVEKPECYVMRNDVPFSPDRRDYFVDITFLQDISGLAFIEHRNVGQREKIVTARLQGQDVNSTLQSVNIRVRISP